MKTTRVQITPIKTPRPASRSYVIENVLAPPETRPRLPNGPDPGQLSGLGLELALKTGPGLELDRDALKRFTWEG